MLKKLDFLGTKNDTLCGMERVVSICSIYIKLIDGIEISVIFSIVN